MPSTSRRSQARPDAGRRRPRRQRAAAARRAARRRDAAAQRCRSPLPRSRSSRASTRSWSLTATVRRSGFLALQNLAARAARPYPLDVLGAESEGMIGYMIEQALGEPAFRPAGGNAADAGESSILAIPPSPSRQSRSARLRRAPGLAAPVAAWMDHGARRQVLAPRRRLSGAAAHRGGCGDPAPRARGGSGDLRRRRRHTGHRHAGGRDLAASRRSSTRTGRPRFSPRRSAPMPCCC